jgi:hypothetical protein
MSTFRARQWGSGDWTTVDISESGEEDTVEPALTSIIGSALETCPLHVQRLNEEGEWEDLE